VIWQLLSDASVRAPPENSLQEFLLLLMSKKTECMQGGFAASYKPQFEGLSCVQGPTLTEMDTSGLDRDLGSRGSDWFEGTEHKRHPEITPRTGALPRICHIMARSLDFGDLALNLGCTRRGHSRMLAPTARKRASPGDTACWSLALDFPASGTPRRQISVV